MPPPATATFATLSALGGRETTPAERSSGQSRSQTRRVAVAVACALLALACGGISEHHEDAADGGAEAALKPGAPSAEPSTAQPDGQPQSRSDTPADDEGTKCGDVCSQCTAQALGKDCVNVCASVIAQASSAGCSSALASVLRCREKAADPCGAAACPTEDNALTACVIDYCDDHYMADVCVVPL